MTFESADFKITENQGVISEDLALIQTVDFFTPVVDDAHAFGRIAAAKVFSGVYAMGGVPKTAMNLVAFPTGRIPIMAEALDFARMGLIPAGAYRNRQFREDMVSIGNSVDRAVADLCFDLQTSGGLLRSVPPKIADDLLKRLQDAGGD